MYLIGGGRVVTRDSSVPFIENGAVAIDGAVIKKVGGSDELKAEFPDAKFIDARGGVIMPGLINAHAHLYCSLLRGLALPDHKPTSHYQNLCGRSWRLDRELGFRDVVNSAYAGAIECIKNGVTTVFDHHASYKGVPGTLMAIAGVIERAGIRASLCYETSHRCGFLSCSEAIAENESFIDFCGAYDKGGLRAMFGLHAPFTLSDFDIEDCVRRNGGRVGFHVHVSESLDDSFVCMHNYGKSPIKRLLDLGVLGENTILAHCVHTSPEEWDIIASSGAFTVNNPQSNLSNAVGTADVLGMLERGVRAGLGTDSFTYDMIESARAFVTAQRSRSGRSYVGLSEAAKLLFENNASFASRIFGAEIGVLKPGAQADVIVMDYTPFTRFDGETSDAHIIFGMSGRNCITTMAAGKLLMLDRKLLTLNESKLSETISADTDALWARISDAGKGSWLPSFSIIEPTENE